MNEPCYFNQEGVASEIRMFTFPTTSTSHYSLKSGVSKVLQRNKYAHTCNYKKEIADQS